MIDLKHFNEPFCIVLVGLPGAGKTTLRESMHFNAILRGHLNNDVICVSSDDFLEAKAKELNKDYNEIFRDYVNQGAEHCNRLFREAVFNRQNIIVDRTNINSKSRKKFLSQLPKNYTKVAICLAPEENTLINRLKTRTDKKISFEVVAEMIERFEPPQYNEGFNSIVTIMDNDTSSPDYLSKQFDEIASQAVN